MKEFDALKAKLNSVCPELPLVEQEPMSRHTTFRVGAATVILAMGAGKAGAKGIDEYLRKK